MPTTRLQQFALAVVLSALAARTASAACVNRFLARQEGPRQVITLLTGKLTFQEAQALMQNIKDKKAPPLAWVDAKGRVVATQFGDLKIVRPMPVGCDGRSSGVVLIVTFGASFTPTKELLVKLDDATTVSFEQQANQ